MPSTKYEELSYPTHFLKSMGSVISNYFLNTELNKPHFLRNEMVFMHCLLPINQNIYSVGIFRAPVVTQGSLTVWALNAYFSDSQNAAFELLVWCM